MEAVFVITYKNEEVDKEAIDTFLESIRSKYASKAGIGNMIFIVSSENSSSIFNKINKDNQTINFFVSKLLDFYGSLPVSTWDWLKEKLPEIKIEDD